jgi:hypothetical protein
VGAGIVALASKTYFVKGFGDKDKYSCKGIQKKHNVGEISFQKYKAVLMDNEKSVVTNRGMRVMNNNQVYGAGDEVNQEKAIYGYSVEKVGLSAKYDKRRVLDDKISTVPLSI